jgi:hypothetical protein
MRYGIGERGRLSYCKQRLQILFFGFVTEKGDLADDERGEDKSTATLRRLCPIEPGRDNSRR